MKRNVCLILLVLFFSSPVFIHSQTLISLDDAIVNFSRYLQERLPRNTRVALLVIQNENPELGEFILNRISVALVNGNHLRIVERSAAALERINQEMARHLSAQVSQETELQIGRQLGAEIIISGSFSQAGQNWRLDIQAVNIETTQRLGHFQAGNIRADSSFTSLASGRSLAVIFDGDELASRERQTITSGLRNALETHNTALEISDSASPNAGYSIKFNIFLSRTSVGLLEAEVTLVFLQRGRIIFENNPYIIRETNQTMIARRIVEQLRNDRAFFNRVNTSIR